MSTLINNNQAENNWVENREGKAQQKNPSYSPSNPQANLLDNLIRDIEVAALADEKAEKVAEEIFDYLYDKQHPISNHDFLNGEIPLTNKNKRVDLYARIINGLVKIAVDHKTGAFKKITPELVSMYDSSSLAGKEANQSVVLAKCMGGSELLKTLCILVYSELSYRTPTGKVSKANAQAFFETQNSHSN